MSFVLLKVISLVVPLRADRDEEASGLDQSEHGEEAYVHTGGVTAT
jgi:Amt family ammonium transporter